MDIDTPDDYEPPPDRIPDRAPERAPVDTPPQNRPFWRADETDEGVIKPVPSCCCRAAVVPPLSRASATPVMRQLRRSSAARYVAAGLRLA